MTPTWELMFLREQACWRRYQSICSEFRRMTLASTSEHYKRRKIAHRRTCGTGHSNPNEIPGPRATAIVLVNGLRNTFHRVSSEHRFTRRIRVYPVDHNVP